MTKEQEIVDRMRVQAGLVEFCPTSNDLYCAKLLRDAADLIEKLLEERKDWEIVNQAMRNAYEKVNLTLPKCEVFPQTF